MTKATKPEVFIIESLDFKDEKQELFEGKIISQILALSDKSCEYIYLRTRKELKKIIKYFSSSNYRYLHISCHGNAKALYTTLDKIPFKEFASIVSPVLRDRRLFLSACHATNVELAKELMKDSGCYSILGPRKAVRFNDAAILWASLYHVMFTADEKRIKQSVLKAKAQETSNMYRVPLVYIRRDTDVREGYTMYEINPKNEV